MFSKRDNYYDTPRIFYTKKLNPNTNTWNNEPEDYHKLAGKWAVMKYYNSTGIIPPKNFYYSFAGNNRNVQQGYNETYNYVFSRLRAGYPGLSDSDKAFLEQLDSGNYIAGRYKDIYTGAFKKTGFPAQAPRLKPGLLEDTAATIAPFGAAIFAGSVGTLTGNPALGLAAGVLSKPFLDKGLEAHGHTGKFNPDDLDNKVERTAQKIYEKSTLTMNEARKVSETAALTGLATGIAQNAWDKTVKSNNTNPSGIPEGFSAVPRGTAHTAYLPKGGGSRTYFNNGRISRYRYTKHSRYGFRRFRYNNWNNHKKYIKKYRKFRRIYF